MQFGSPDFVLSIIAMVMAATVIKTAIRAKYGLPMRDRPHRREGNRRGEEVETLRTENARLASRVEHSEDRVAVLERIVTDSGYHLAHEIERLRDDKGNVQ